MTIPTRIELGVRRRGITAALTAAVLLAVAGYAGIAASAATQMRAARAGALIGDLHSEQSARLDALSDATVRHGIAGDPLDGRLINVALARDARQHGQGRAAVWLPTIVQLGWRDTSSLQNRLYVAAKASDMTSILDTSDALMRRQQLMDQVIPVLSMVEADPTLHGALVDRLAANPPWRAAYLSAIAHLKERSQLIARFELLQQLQRRHVRLGRSEVVPSIVALDRAHLPQYGFALWQRIQPGVVRPLDDPKFARAGRNDQAGHDPVPYEWQTMSGEGFRAEAVSEGAQTTLSIDWNGRGVPVFAQQRTSATSGWYALDLEVSPEERADLPALVFRLVCGETTTAFAPAAGDVTHLRSIQAIPCSYPVLQIAGDIQSSVAAHQLTINRLTMLPLGAAATAR